MDRNFEVATPEPPTPARGSTSALVAMAATMIVLVLMLTSC
jgi:hypothetical protein